MQGHICSCQSHTSLCQGHTCSCKVIYVHVKVIPVCVKVIPVLEGKPLQQKSTCACDTLLVRAPVVQTIIRKLSQHVETLRGRDVPMTLLLNLSEHPRLYECPSAANVNMSTYSIQGMCDMS